MSMLKAKEAPHQEFFEQLRADFAKNCTAVEGRSPAWIRDVREKAFARFVDVGIPTTDHEDWRFTNTDAIVSGGFRTRWGAAPTPSAKDLQGWSMDTAAAAAELVFIDGVYCAELSRRGPLPAGVEVLDLAEAIGSGRDFVRRHYAQYADPELEAFVAWNTAFADSGACVFLPDAAIVKGAIHLLFVSTEKSQGVVTHPRSLIVAGASSQAVIVETYAGLSGSYFTNAVTEIVAGENSNLEHSMIELDSKDSINVSMLRVEQERNSNFTSHSVLLGGGLVRNNVHPVLAGEGAESVLNGLYVSSGRQHMDNFMRVEHAKPHGDSRQFYKGIVLDESRAVFSGRIIVHKNAQKTDAKQTNMNLLLSDRAQIDTKPQLEIYADDVKCTHGATIGRLNDDAVFYLRTRGLSEASARSLLVRAFASESLGRMRDETIRRSIERLLDEILPLAAIPGEFV